MHSGRLPESSDKLVGEVTSWRLHMVRNHYPLRHAASISAGALDGRFDPRVHVIGVYDLVARLRVDRVDDNLGGLGGIAYEREPCRFGPQEVRNQVAGCLDAACQIRTVEPLWATLDRLRRAAARVQHGNRHGPVRPVIEMDEPGV